eukprot:jgi/Chlat1/9108/Chrsp97S08381
MAIPASAEVVSSKIVRVSFGFYADEEARAISVKRITNTAQFDSLKNPAPDGVYDPALGPLDQNSRCTTCRLRYAHCPGHFGHIELAAPVYHPLVFMTMLKLLRSTCLYCHRFKMATKKVALYRRAIQLLANGKLIEASAVHLFNEKQDKEAALEAALEGGIPMEDETFQEVITHVDVEEPPSGDEYQQWTTHTVEAARTIIGSFLRKMPSTKCENCQAHVPSVKREDFKLFLAPLPVKNEAANLMKGLTLASVLQGSAGQDAVEALETKMAERLEQQGIRAVSVAVPPAEVEDEYASELDEEGPPTVAAQPVQKLPDLKPGRKPRAKGKGGIDSVELSAAPEKAARKPVYLTPLEVREHLRLLWKSEAETVSLIWGAVQASTSPLGTGSVRLKRQSDPSVFFLQTVLVSPNKFRPPSYMNDSIFEHPQNTNLAKVLNTNLQLSEASRSGDLDRATRSWLLLQDAVQLLLSGPRGAASTQMPPGIKQQLEKKEGLFRKNMMGKRVNYACRSVISPDPYIATNEIGIPPYFATRLSYRELVTAYNVEELRQAVVNGHAVHPGANAVEDNQGRLITLSLLSPQKREALARTLLKSGRAVYRHLRDGDAVLVNRQPTLHKPGIMAHTARVLRSQKTLRLHYANCSTYNADFDGDEMNVHLPQDEFGRAEAYAIVNANEQYIVPTSGAPIRGLIQDHIVSGTLLTKKDTFLTKEEYHFLVYIACSTVGATRDLNEPVFEPLPPAILKPQPLWTGKQVLSSLILHLTRGRAPLSFKSACKVASSYWGAGNGEGEVLVRNGELLAGILDKAQFGKFGLVHSVHELYGGKAAGDLLSALSRLLTNYLQLHGFTCGIDDLLLVPSSEEVRSTMLQATAQHGADVYAAFSGLGSRPPGLSDEEWGKRVRDAVSARVRSRDDAAAALDMKMTSALSPLTSNIIKQCIPSGQLKPFPRNCMSLMTVTGAKGSIVNFSQISAMLGQQELEGRRVPSMASNKSLPCFRPNDPAPRAGGYIVDRFLTGLRPQEYYFHCMAGRDGLVDTTVKTSRSGYLQRCLIKNLESLKVEYDYTVRDNDSGIVQFYYGEDGLDPTRTSFLNNFAFMHENLPLVTQQVRPEVLLGSGVEQAGHRNSSDTTTLLDEFTLGSCLGAVSESFAGKLGAFVDETRKKLKKKAQRKEFRDVMNMRYMRALAQPGEAVGVVAAQSVGEPSTQMTLNTFHFAGRGEANVTLGIPRLREILMTASQKIKTPVMTLPLRMGCTTEDAQTLAGTLQRLQLPQVLAEASVVEIPVAQAADKVTNERQYRVRLRFHPEHRYPEHLQLTFEECADVFKRKFVPIVIAAVNKAGKLARAGNTDIGVSTISSAPRLTAGGNGASQKKSEDADMEDGEDLLDSETLREQRNRSNDASYEAPDEEERDLAKAAQKVSQRNDVVQVDAGAESDEETQPDTTLLPLEGVDADANGSMAVNPNDRHIVDSDSYTCTTVLSVPLDCPKLLVLEMVERTAASVSVRSTPGIGQCYVVQTADTQQPAVQTDGVNMEGVWLHDDVVDTERITTNDIGGVLHTYGVEAARATILSEVSSVFNAYGIAVDRRHLSLIADFMTFQGGYRQACCMPCNRLGIDSSPSPLLKMSFETAGQFLTDATLRGLSDTLESPSARIVMGLPVTLGTGRVELLQHLEVLELC